MAKHWFIRRDNREIGPLTSSELRAMAAQGDIAADHEVRREGQEVWVLASSVVGLLPPTEPSTPLGVSKPHSQAKPEQQWYYADRKQRCGPSTREEIVAMVASDRLAKTVLVWSPGMDDWKKADEVDGLLPSDLLQLPPPIPGSLDVPPLPTSTTFMANLESVIRNVPKSLKQITTAGESPSKSTSQPEVTRPPRSSSRTAVLVLSIIGAFFSLFVGGCTAAVGDGLAKTGDSLNRMSDDFDSRFDRYRSHSSPRAERLDTSEMRNLSARHAMLGFIEMVLGIVGGILGYRHFGTTPRFSLGMLSLSKYRLGGGLLLIAALLSVSNVFTFITAGIMNGVAAALCLLSTPDRTFSSV